MNQSKDDGFSNKEILVVIRDDLKAHIKDSRVIESKIQEQLARRPKRSEIIGWMTSIGIIVGAVIVLIP